MSFRGQAPLVLLPTHHSFLLQIVSSASTDLQDYTYYFVPAPWLSVKLLRLLQCYPPPGKACGLPASAFPLVLSEAMPPDSWEALGRSWGHSLMPCPVQHLG